MRSIVFFVGVLLRVPLVIACVIILVPAYVTFTALSYLRDLLFALLRSFFLIMRLPFAFVHAALLNQPDAFEGYLQQIASQFPSVKEFFNEMRGLGGVIPLAFSFIWGTEAEAVDREKNDQTQNLIAWQKVLSCATGLIVFSAWAATLRPEDIAQMLGGSNPGIVALLLAPFIFALLIPFTIVGTITWAILAFVLGIEPQASFLR